MGCKTPHEFRIRSQTVRAIIAVLDSLGVGAAADAARFGDEGANTLGHILSACAVGAGDESGLRKGPLEIPNLLALGLGEAMREATKEILPLGKPERITAKYGFAAETSCGKDTPSGHWEMVGLPVTFQWRTFPKTIPSFPESLTAALIEKAHLPGVLGNCHASGTAIIENLGTEHMASGKPILYTSGDSVVQIAAHEKTFGLERLYDVCAIARNIVDDYNVGRVIARPFIGAGPGDFKRTHNRKDLSTPPHGPTLLDSLYESGGTVIAIGKIGDIFAHRGITKTLKAHGIEGTFDCLMDQVKHAPDNCLIFANFVDFDTLYGHRRNVPGYAAALELFDTFLPAFQSSLQADDIVIFTADHGCDPTWPGSDHTREYIPILTFGGQVTPGPIGRRASFADIGQSLAQHLNLPPMRFGKSFLSS